MNYVVSHFCRLHFIHGHSDVRIWTLNMQYHEHFTLWDVYKYINWLTFYWQLKRIIFCRVNLVKLCLNYLKFSYLFFDWELIMYICMFLIIQKLAYLLTNYENKPFFWDNKKNIFVLKYYNYILESPKYIFNLNELKNNKFLLI